MSFINVQQNTDEWFLLRAGKVTGSSISTVMANEGKAFGGPAQDLAVKLATEQITGNPIVSEYTNAHMLRGHVQEPIARRLYEDRQFIDVSNGGFFDNGPTGCSPDGLVYTDGIIEIKCVIPPVQYKTIKRNSHDPTYKWQLLFNLLESGSEWIDYISFCADFPLETRMFIQRLTRDSFGDMVQRMADRLGSFLKLIEEVKGIIEGR